MRQIGNFALDYTARLSWEGNCGIGTASYRGYGRRFRVEVAGKPDIVATADPSFGGEGDLHNPEDLFLAAIAGCHMLTYLALCARSHVCVVAYRDTISGRLEVDSGGGGRFAEVRLEPHTTVADAAHLSLATDLHGTAHARCFVASSVGVPIRLRPSVEAA